MKMLNGASIIMYNPPEILQYILEDHMAQRTTTLSCGFKKKESVLHVELTFLKCTTILLEGSLCQVCIPRKMDSQGAINYSHSE